MTRDPPRDASLPPGYDDEDPYEGEDLSTYPDWWRRNIEAFWEFGMRPYRPPRLADGTVSPPLLETLSEEYGVDVRFQSTDLESGWELAVDGDPVREVEHERDGGGYTVYHITREELEAAIRAAATE